MEIKVSLRDNAHCLISRCFILKGFRPEVGDWTVSNLPLIVCILSFSSSSRGSIRGSPQRTAGVWRTQGPPREGSWPGHGSRRGPGAAAGWSRAAFRQQWLWVCHRKGRLLGASVWSEKTSSRFAGIHHITTPSTCWIYLQIHSAHLSILIKWPQWRVYVTPPLTPEVKKQKYMGNNT